MKKDYSQNKNISISIKKFQERLDTTRFEGTTIKEILEKYFEQKITTNKQKRNIYEKNLEEYFNKILEENNLAIFLVV